MARNDPVPADANLVRLIKPKFAPRDDDGHLIGIHPEAFALREEEDYLSLTARDGFAGTVVEQMAAVDLMMGSSFKSGSLPPKSFLVVSTTDAIRTTCAAEGARVRILEEPVDGNGAHVAVRRFPRDAHELYEKLASTTFAERHDLLIIRAQVPPAPAAENDENQ